ncbi:MAG: hypothetical protein AAGF58_03420 [Pseudomonadota bacterium]
MFLESLPEDLLIYALCLGFVALAIFNHPLTPSEIVRRDDFRERGAFSYVRLWDKGDEALTFKLLCIAVLLCVTVMV